MRRAFIAFVIIVFLVYCWASVAYQNQVPVPAYRTVKVELLGGKTRAQWDQAEGEQFHRLMELESKRYQLPEGNTLAVGAKKLDSGAPLTSDDFKAIIAASPAGSAPSMELRDPSAIYNLVSLHYRLRDPIVNPADPEGPPLFNYGEPLTKSILDELIRHKIEAITINGAGAPVTFQFGTSIMILLIFLALVAALKPLVWDPFQALLDKRQKELAIGAEAARRNQAEREKLEQETIGKNRDLRLEIQAERMRRLRAADKEADGLVKVAQTEAKKAKQESLADIASQMGAAEKALAAEMPKLAEMIAASILNPGTPPADVDGNAKAD